MSKHEKAIAKLCAQPTPSGFQWNDLQGVLKHLGYKALPNPKTGGSRRKFYHEGKDVLISCHEPHPSSVVSKGCIEAVVDHLRANGFIRG